MSNRSPTKVKVVWTANEKGRDPSWSRAGIAWEIEEGLLFMQLDRGSALGQYLLKDWEPRTAFAMGEPS